MIKVCAMYIAAIEAGASYSKIMELSDAFTREMDTLETSKIFLNL